jgi:hypothetical protein
VTPAFTRTFDFPGDFTAFNAAVSFLRARQFSVGPLQGPDPVGILFGPQIVIAKWRHLSKAQRDALHGIITGADKRGGPVTVEIYATAPAAARAAVAQSKAA